MNNCKSWTLTVVVYANWYQLQIILSFILKFNVMFELQMLKSEYHITNNISKFIRLTLLRQISFEKNPMIMFKTKVWKNFVMFCKHKLQYSFRKLWAIKFVNRYFTQHYIELFVRKANIKRKAVNRMNVRNRDINPDLLPFSDNRII